MKAIIWLLSIVASFTATAQNVGVGTANPQSKLHINSSADEALRLESSNPFLSLYSNGSYKGYLWKSPYSIEVGSAVGSNLPISFAPNGSPRLYVNTNGFVGIGNSNPTAPLSFLPALGKKITLYPGATGDVGLAVQGNLFQLYADNPSADIAFGYDQGGTFTENMRLYGNGLLKLSPTFGKKLILFPGAVGDAGFGIAGNRLQIFSDNPNADVAIGFDAGGTFNEKLAVKPTGAIAVNGSVGNAGQVLQSNGAGNAVTWVNKPSVILYNQTNAVDIEPPTVAEFLPGLNGQYFTLPQSSKVIITASFKMKTDNLNPDSRGLIIVQLLDNNNNSVGWVETHYSLGPHMQTVTLAGIAILGAGTYQTRVTINRSPGSNSTYVWPAGNPAPSQGSQLFLQIFPD